MKNTFAIEPHISLGETLNQLVINGQIPLGQPEFSVQFSLVKTGTDTPVNVPAGGVNLSGTVVIKRSELPEVSEKAIAEIVAAQKGLTLI